MQKIVSLGLTREPRARRQCHARSTFKDSAPTPLDITPGSVVREGPPGFVYQDWRGEAPFYRTRIGQPRPASELRWNVKYGSLVFGSGNHMSVWIRLLPETAILVQLNTPC